MPKHLYVGIKGVIVNRGKALILRSKSTIGPTETYWDLPGGRINGEESIEQALKRELTEEVLNLKKFEVGKLLLAWRYPGNFPNGTGIVLIYFKVLADLNAVEMSEEHSEYRWIDKHQLAELAAKDSEVEFPLGNQEAIKLALS